MKKLIVLLAILPFLTFAQQANQVNIEFQNSETYSTGAGPGNLVRGDFNNDHIIDLAVAATSGSNIGILINSGDTTFSAVNGFFATDPVYIAAARFNADSNMDIAVAVQYNLNYYINIFYGSGDGLTFTSTDPPYTLGGPPKAMIAADFNNDGIADLATANSSEDQGSISILQGINGGGFQNSLTYSAGTYPNSLISADFNADGFNDIAVTNLGENTVSVFLFDTSQNSTGTYIQFQPPLSYNTGNTPWGIATADLNNDSYADIIVTNSGDTTISIFLNKGNDSIFSAPSKQFVGSNPWSVVAADFNGDHAADLAVTSRDSGLTVFQGHGDGTFTKSWNYAVNLSNDAALYFPLYLIAQDLNSDLLPDLVIANHARNNVVVLRTVISDHNAPQARATNSAIAASAAVTVYPVPSSDIINVNTNRKIETLTLCDMQGKSILSSTKSSITVADLSPGIYLLYIKTDNGTIVKQVAVTSQ